MATKTLTITEDAYARLAALKREHESFSEVIRRIIPQRSLHELVGTLSEEEARALKRSIADLRTQVRERFA